MARYCPNCGAENPDYSYYCSKCATSLRFEQERVFSVRPIRRVSRPRDEPAEIRKALKNVNLLILITSGVAVLLHLPSLASNGEDVTWVRVSFLAFLSLFVAATYSSKMLTDDKHVRFFRHRDFSKDALAEAKGFNLGFIYYAVAIVAAVAIAQIWLYEGIVSVIVSIAVSAFVVLLIFLTMMVNSRVVVEADGICVGNPRSIVRSFIPFGIIGFVKVTTRTMSFRFNAKTPLGTVPKKLFIRSDPSAIALAIRNASPSTQVSIDPRVSDLARMNRRIQFEP